jgi:hypothetical protein
MTNELSNEQLIQTRIENDVENALLLLLIQFEEFPDAFHRICFSGLHRRDTFRKMAQKMLEMANLPGVNA